MTDAVGIRAEGNARLCKFRKFCQGIASAVFGNERVHDRDIPGLEVGRYAINLHLDYLDT